MRYFGAAPLAAVDERGRIWFANAREYRISRRSLEGDTTLVFSQPAEAAPLGDREREYVRSQLYRVPSLLAEELAALPETKPLLHRILPDNAGHPFIFVDVAGELPGTIMDVFRDDGLFLGRIRLPTPVPLLPSESVVAYATSEHLYLVVKDALDVPYVARMRIVKGN